MHELHAAQNILETALRQAQAAGAKRIRDLHLVAGQWSTMGDESIRFYWEALSRGTAAEGAGLHFRRVPAELLCLQCGRRSAPAQPEAACPNCGSQRIRITAGEEFYLEAIDCE